MRICVLCFVGLVAVHASILVGQSADKRSATLKRPGIATSVIDFAEDTSVPTMLVSPVLGFPMQCGGDGTAFLEMMDPPEFRKRRLFSISSRGIHEFALESVTDLYDAVFRGYYPNDSGIVVLLYATAKDAKTKSTLDLPNGASEERTRYAGEHHYYAATFDREGAYKGAIQIDDALTVGNIGMFNSGTLLVSGIDQTTKRAVLALLGADGGVLRYLQIPEEMVKWNATTAEAVTHRPADQIGAILPFQFVAFQDRILGIQQHSNMPVLLIDAGGGVKPVRLGLPEGQVINAFVPSSNRWYVRTAPPGDSVDDSDVVLYEIDAFSGKPTRKLLPHGVTDGEITCALNGEFLAFQRNEKGQLIAMRGHASH